MMGDTRGLVHKSDMEEKLQLNFEAVLVIKGHLSLSNS